MNSEEIKKVLITGVTGQDGSLMADYLLANTEHTIIGGVRRLSVKNHQNIEHLKDNPRFKLIDLDITDNHNVDRVVKEWEPDYFINFAANSFVGTSWGMPINHFETNAVAVLYQLEAIRAHVPHCRYYNAGTSEEFGDVETIPQTEEHPLRPRSPYGAAKCAARHLVKVYRDSYDLYAVQGWLFNHEGVRRGEDFVTRKITKGAARIACAMHLDAKFVPLEVGNIEAKRDWSDAEDFVCGVWMMLNQQEVKIQKEFDDNGKTMMFDFDFVPTEYVLSSNETHTVREFIEMAFESCFPVGLKWEGKGEDEVLKLNGDVVVRINPDFYRPAEVDLLLGDSNKIRKELGWKPETDFKGLVKKMVKQDLSVIN